MYNAQLEKVALSWAKQCNPDAEFSASDFGNLEFNEGDFGRNSARNESEYVVI